MAITIHDILSKCEPAVFSLGLQLRDHLISLLPNIIEVPDASVNIIGYGYSFAYKDLICTIIPSKKGSSSDAAKAVNCLILSSSSQATEKYTDMLRSIHPPLLTAQH